MNKILSLAFVALLVGGCAVYADPYPYSGGVYIAPPPVIVGPVYPGWEWHRGYYHEGWHRRG